LSATSRPRLPRLYDLALDGITLKTSVRSPNSTPTMKAALF
jgi:hypothetical protein